MFSHLVNGLIVKAGHVNVRPLNPKGLSSFKYLNNY